MLAVSGLSLARGFHDGTAYSATWSECMAGRTTMESESAYPLPLQSSKRAKSSMVVQRQQPYERHRLPLNAKRANNEQGVASLLAVLENPGNTNPTQIEQLSQGINELIEDEHTK